LVDKTVKCKRRVSIVLSLNSA